MSTFPESLITAGSLFHNFAAATVNIIFLVRKLELDGPSLQSMEGHLQTSMEVWVDNNNKKKTDSNNVVMT